MQFFLPMHISELFFHLIYGVKNIFLLHIKVFRYFRLKWCILAFEDHQESEVTLLENLPWRCYLKAYDNIQSNLSHHKELSRGHDFLDNQTH